MRGRGNPLLTLAELEERHSSGPEPQRAHLRRKARARATELGVPVPEWASMRQDATRKQRAVMRNQSGGSSSSWGCRRAREKPLAPTSTAAPVVIDAAALDRLRAWRLNNPGTVVQVTGDRVVVHFFQRPALTFKNAAHAVAALCA